MEYEACHSQEEKESKSPECLSFIIIRKYQKPQIKIRIILKVIIFSVCYFDFTQTLSQYKSKKTQGNFLASFWLKVYNQRIRGMLKFQRLLLSGNQAFELCFQLGHRDRVQRPVEQRETCKRTSLHGDGS